MQAQISKKVAPPFSKAALKSFYRRYRTKSATISTPILGLDLPDIWTPPSCTRPLLPKPVGNAPTAKVIDGKSIAEEIKSEIADEVSRMKDAIAKVPGLAVIIVGQRKDSQTYVRNKIKACQEVGIASLMAEFPEDSAENEVVRAVASFNDNPSVHGILVQLPLPQVISKTMSAINPPAISLKKGMDSSKTMSAINPPAISLKKGMDSSSSSSSFICKHMDEEKILNAVSLEKDVDGFHPLNMGNLAMRGREPLFIPCTPKGCIELLLRSGIEIMGKKAVVIGRSNIVGTPTSLLLQRHHATVSVIHAYTRNPDVIAREADIVVSAVGVANLVRGDWLKPGAVVIDVGINPVEDPSSEHGYHLTGDVCYEEALPVVSAITPVPGGVGPMTIAMLLSNTLNSAKRAFRFS